MFALHSGANGIGHIEAVIVVIAILGAIFWREVLKILLIVALLLIIIVVVGGTVVIIDVLQHVIT